MEIPEMLQVSTIRVKYQFTRRVEQAQFYSSGKLVFWKVYEQKTTFIEEISVLFSLHDNRSLYSTFRNKKMDTSIRTLYDILSWNFRYRKPFSSQVAKRNVV